MRKKRGGGHDEEHVNHEAWVIPYADMITLLMGLFIVMWSIGNADMEKLREVATSFASSVGMNSPSVGSNAGAGGAGLLEGGTGKEDAQPLPGSELDPQLVDQALAALDREEEAKQAQAQERSNLEEVQQAITSQAGAAGIGDRVAVRTEDRGLIVSIVSEGVLFEPGSADLRPEGTAVLDGLAAALRSLPNQVAVEGHTDDRPISSGRFPSNWELSTARATSVVRYLLQAHGFPAGRMTASGYGETRPIDTNATAEGRSRNRRVDIAVLSTAPLAPAATTGGG